MYSKLKGKNLNLLHAILRNLRIGICLLFLLIITSVSFADAISLKSESSSVNIESLSVDPAILIPLHEAITHYKIGYQWSIMQEQMVLSKDGIDVKLMLGNPFVLVNGGKLRLLSRPPVILRGAVALPPQDVAAILSVLLPSMDVLYDETKSLIEVKQKPAVNNTGVAPPLTNTLGSSNLDESELMGNFELETVVIDSGHGGNDPGANRSGVREKDIVLDVALRLEKLLGSQTGIKVIMTRDTDVFIPLPRRTSIANRYPPSSTIFICIHCNASRSRVGGYGTETYVFDLEATDNEARALAQRENQGEEMDLTRILSHCYHTGTEPYSLELAKKIQSTVTRKLGLSNRGVRRAAFYVLAGTKMPAILLELAYISNSAERAKLKDESFRQDAAQALFDATMDFKKATGKSVAKDKTSASSANFRE